MENLRFYEAFRKVPDAAKRSIGGGRLKGKTDINPMWRLKVLTETFGPVGIGWKYEIIRQWIENGANNEIAAFCNILLFYKQDDVWSEGIPGTGGSMFVAKENSGPYTSDECFKMALTDAISVSAKALGIGADVYWEKDATKYDSSPPQESPQPKSALNTNMNITFCPLCQHMIKPIKKKDGSIVPADIVLAEWGMCVDCHNKQAPSGNTALVGGAPDVV